MKRILALIGTNILGKITAVISGILIARLLGSDLKGIFSLMLLLPSMFVSFFDFGIGQATAYYYKKTDSSEEKNKILTNMLVFYLLLSVCVPIILLLCRPIVASIFPLLTEDWMYMLSIGSYPIFLLQNYITTTSIAVGRVKRYSFATIGKEVLFLAVILVLFITQAVSINLVFIAYIGTNLLLTLALIVLILVPFVHINVKYISPTKVLELLKYGYKLNILSIVSWASNKVSLIMAGNLLSASDVGIYSISIALSEMVFIIANSAAIIIFIDNADTNNNEQENYMNIKITMFLITISGIGLALFGGIMIRILYSVEYIGAYVPLLILLPGTVMFGYYKLYGNKLAAVGKPELLIYISLMSLAVVVCLNYVFIPLFGMKGMASACTIAYCVSAFMAVGLSSRVFNKGFFELLLVSRSEFRNLILQVTVMIQKRVK